MPHAGGRPTKYEPSMVDKIEQYLTIAIPENMDIPTIEGIALLLDINIDTVYEWGKKYPEFSEALKKCKILQKQYLVKTGIFGGKEINATIIALMLKVNHDMIETSKLQIDDVTKLIQNDKQYIESQVQALGGEVSPESTGTEVSDDGRTE